MFSIHYWEERNVIFSRDLFRHFLVQKVLGQEEKEEVIEIRMAPSLLSWKEVSQGKNPTIPFTRKHVHPSGGFAATKNMARWKVVCPLPQEKNSIILLHQWGRRMGQFIYIKDLATIFDYKKNQVVCSYNKNKLFMNSIWNEFMISKI